MSLRLEQFSWHAGAQRRLDEVNIEIRYGRVHALLGLNGSGKSSLIETLAGTPLPRAKLSGNRWLDKQRLETLSPADLAQRRAVMTQEGAEPVGFSVLELVQLGRFPHEPEPTHTRYHCVHAALQITGSLGLANRRYAHLSGGERARVRLACALAQLWPADQADAEPDFDRRILLLDEPAAHLDIGQQHRCLQISRRFANAGGAVVISLHDPALAATYADDVSLLAAGRIVETGPREQVLTAEKLSEIYQLPVRLRAMEGHHFAVWTVPTTD